MEGEGAGRRVFLLRFQIVNKLFDRSLESKVAWPASELQGSCRTLGVRPDGLEPAQALAPVRWLLPPARLLRPELPAKAREHRAPWLAPKASQPLSLFLTG